MLRTIPETVQIANEDCACPECGDLILLGAQHPFSLVAFPCQCPEPEPCPAT